MSKRIEIEISQEAMEKIQEIEFFSGWSKQKVVEFLIQVAVSAEEATEK